MIKSFITKNHGLLECEVDERLQRKNVLVDRGIYLVEVENGVVWGYDMEVYEEVNNSIVKKKINEGNE